MFPLFSRKRSIIEYSSHKHNDVIFQIPYNLSTSAGTNCVGGRSSRLYLQQDTDFISGTHLQGPSAQISQSSSLKLICQTADARSMFLRLRRTYANREILTRMLDRSQPAFETWQSVLHLLEDRCQSLRRCRRIFRICAHAKCFISIFLNCIEDTQRIMLQRKI